MNNVLVEMSEEEAILYRAFLEHRQAFRVMLAARVFGVPYGCATIHFKAGVIDNIRVEEVTYHRK